MDKAETNMVGTNQVLATPTGSVAISRWNSVSRLFLALSAVACVGCVISICFVIIGRPFEIWKCILAAMVCMFYLVICQCYIRRTTRWVCVHGTSVELRYLIGSSRLHPTRIEWRNRGIVRIFDDSRGTQADIRLMLMEDNCTQMLRELASRILIGGVALKSGGTYGGEAASKSCH